MKPIALLSAKGSPGVTTIACRLARALAIRRPSGADLSEYPGVPEGVGSLVVEADLAGGDIAARFGLTGTPGLSTLSLRAERGITGGEFFRHTQELAPKTRVLVGIAGAAQGSSVVRSLPTVLEAVAALPIPTVIDLGRLDPTSPLCSGWLSTALLCGLVVKSDTESVIHARSMSEVLQGLGVVIEILIAQVAGGHHPDEIGRALDLPVLAELPLRSTGWDVTIDQIAGSVIDRLASEDGTSSRTTESVAGRAEGHALGTGRRPWLGRRVAVATS
ncbi:MAG TPA: hypothetical protein VGS21_04985 [Acidimicrobiales bacterium]|nr:hypothetical protein [Acidimicrobiales bacterium]